MAKPRKQTGNLVPNLTISEAADRLGRKPWEVQRMIDSGLLPSVTLVAEADVAELGTRA